MASFRLALARRRARNPSRRGIGINCDVRRLGGYGPPSSAAKLEVTPEEPRAEQIVDQAMRTARSESPPPSSKHLRFDQELIALARVAAHTWGVPPTSAQSAARLWTRFSGSRRKLASARQVWPKTAYKLNFGRMPEILKDRGARARGIDVAANQYPEPRLLARRVPAALGAQGGRESSLNRLADANPRAGRPT
jgi:hypothetical protein